MRPLGLLLTRRSENSTVTLCHTGTRDMVSHIRNADIVVAAAGVPHFIKPDMIKPGAALLDGPGQESRQPEEDAPVSELRRGAQQDDADGPADHLASEDDGERVRGRVGLAGLSHFPGRRLLPTRAGCPAPRRRAERCRGPPSASPPD